MDIIGKIEGVTKEEGENKPVKIRVKGKTISVWDAPLQEKCIIGKTVRVEYTEKTVEGYKYPFKNAVKIEDAKETEIEPEKKQESSKNGNEIMAEVALKEANALVIAQINAGEMRDADGKLREPITEIIRTSKMFFETIVNLSRMVVKAKEEA